MSGDHLNIKTIVDDDLFSLSEQLPPPSSPPPPSPPSLIPKQLAPPQLPPPPLAPAPEQPLSQINSHTINHYVYQFTSEKGQLTISVRNLLNCQEFSLAIDDTSDIFNDCTIIKNIKLLQKILHDGFTNSFDVNLHFEIPRNLNQYWICVDVKSTYVQDKIILRLPLVEQTITPQQIFDAIDYRMQHFTQQLPPGITVTPQQICDTIDHKLRKFTQQNFVAPLMQQQQQDFIHQIKQLQIQLDRMQADMDDFVGCHSVLVASKIEHKSLLKKSHKRAQIDIFTTETKICIIYKDLDYYLSDNYRIIGFNIKKFKYLTNLTDITFVKCPFTALDFIPVTNTLRRISLYDMSELKTVAYLTKFRYLEQISVLRTYGIIDLLSLAKCPNLKILILPHGTDITGFHNLKLNRQFRIILE
jgi:hypothetical protein